MKRVLYTLIAVGICNMTGASMTGAGWSSVNDPRSFRNEMVWGKMFKDEDAETQAANLSSSPLSDEEKIAILWSAKRAFDLYIPGISMYCMNKIVELLKEKQGLKKVSNYHIGDCLLRSQMGASGGLKKDYDDDTVSDAVILLKNERNGNQKEAEGILSFYTPILQKAGFDL